MIDEIRTDLCLQLDFFSCDNHHPHLPPRTYVIMKTLPSIILRTPPLFLALRAMRGAGHSGVFFCKRERKGGKAGGNFLRERKVRSLDFCSSGVHHGSHLPVISATSPFSQ